MVAESVPALLSVIVNVMVSPTLGFTFETVLASTRSDCCGVSVAPALLFVVTGSNWSLSVIVAVLVCAAALITVAWNCKVCGVTVVTVPTVQTPVAALYAPWLGAADTNVSPAGNRSVTCTLVAESGPWSVSVMVNVMVSPTLGFALLTDLASCKSALCGVALAVALLFVVTGSN